MELYVPELWKEEERKQKLLITVWGKESKKLKPGKLWLPGHAMMSDGKIIRGGLTLNSKDGVAAVNIMINDEDTGYSIVKYDNQYGNVIVFNTPLFLQKGDILNFKTTTSSGSGGNVSNGLVNVLIELNL